MCSSTVLAPKCSRKGPGDELAFLYKKRKIIAVVTLRAFTRGKSFYLGKISLGKFTSGFLFPRLKGHTGDHWTFGGLTSQRIKFQLACSKFWRKNGSRINRIKERFLLLFIILFQRARRARVILLQRLISRRIQRRPPLVYHGLSRFACRVSFRFW